MLTLEKMVPFKRLISIRFSIYMT